MCCLIQTYEQEALILMDGGGPKLLSYPYASHTTNPVTRYPKLSDLTVNSVAQPVSGSSPVITTDSRRMEWMCFIPVRTSYAEFAASNPSGQNDQRPTSWRGMELRKLTSSSVWEELGRAGQDYIDVYTQTAYDCYRRREQYQ
jgi:hypothetical protein